jgi:MFS superfamily sulfate permease-like transporter
MTAGAGFIALAALIFGKWSPMGAVFAALLFGFADNLQSTLTIIGVAIPSEFMLMVPYIATIIAVVGIDLLWGIFIGTFIGLIFVILTNYESVFSVFNHGNEVLIKFQKDVTFLHKLSLKEAFRKIPTGSEVFIDASKVHFMDHDIKLLISEFMSTAKDRGIIVDFKQK